KDLAERARQIGNEVYPKILTLLADDRSKLPRQFDIIFKKHISSGAPGVTLGKRIRLNAAWLGNHPVYLNLVLSHEMAHVAQGYPWHKTSKIPFSGGKGSPIMRAIRSVLRRAGAVRNVQPNSRTTLPVGRAREHSCCIWTKRMAR